jgi:hypothetical protein
MRRIIVPEFHHPQAELPKEAEKVLVRDALAGLSAQLGFTESGNMKSISYGSRPESYERAMEQVGRWQEQARAMELEEYPVGTDDFRRRQRFRLASMISEMLLYDRWGFSNEANELLSICNYQIDTDPDLADVREWFDKAFQPL